MVKIRNRKLLLVGARSDGHAGVILDIIREFNLYEVIGFLDDNLELVGKKICGITVLGTVDDYISNYNHGQINFFICIGDNKIREKIYKKISAAKGELVYVIHPSAVISSTVRIGKAVFIGANVNISHNSVIGESVIINNSVSLDHNNSVGDFVNISPGTTTAGRVQIRKGAFLGTGVVVIPDIIVNEHAFIGAGTVIIRDVKEKVTVVGNPAREINKNIGI